MTALTSLDRDQADILVAGADLLGAAAIIDIHPQSLAATMRWTGQLTVFANRIGRRMPTFHLLGTLEPTRFVDGLVTLVDERWLEFSVAPR